MENKRAKQILVSVRNAEDWINKFDDCKEKKEALRCLENVEDELHKSIQRLSDEVNDNDR